jgi:hypothetical protein
MMARLFVLLAFALSGCSLIVDRSAAQCRSDGDCLRFGGHPSCKAGVCVPSLLGPDGCVLGPPQTEIDYLNHCSTATCVPFDNCGRLGLCSPAEATPATEDPTNVSIPPLVNPVTMPSLRCSDAGPNRIYMYGTSDFAPMLKAVQPLLSGSSPPYRAIYQNASSCAGVAAVFDASKRLMTNPASGSSSYAFYFDDSGQQTPCLLDASGNPIDIGVSNLFSTTCNTPAATYVSGTGVSDYTGPVVPFVLSVPAQSTEVAISAEAAHMIFGLGGHASGTVKDAAPWTDPTYYFIRNSGAGSTVLTAALIDVPKTKFWGVDRLSTDNLRYSMLASTATNQSIGILSIDYADKNRGNLRSLHLQARGQLCGYLPDSNKNAFDKMNVRDGHYPLWGYVHFFTPIGAGGVPSDAARAFITRFSVPRLDKTLLDNVIAASLIPQCAMKVTRSSEVSDFQPQTGLGCGCYFDLRTTEHTDCQSCDTPFDCPADHPACNYGFCELN